MANSAVAQRDSLSTKAAFSVESRITSFLQGGYELGVYYYPPNSRFSFGVAVAGQNVAGAARELLFESSNHDNLTLRLPWLAGFQTRYHFAKHREGFFAELSLGGEEFTAKSGTESQSNFNGFVVPALGYVWHPRAQSGLYLMPKLGAVIIIGRPEEKVINNTSYRLRPFFPSPGVSVGWRF